MKKLILTLSAAAVMLFTASNAAIAGTGGNCGDNLTWTLESGVLTITGTGEMTDAPWLDNSDSITSIVIGDGVTTIAENAFYDCAAKTVSIPDTVTSIGESAFYGCYDLKSVSIPNSVTSIGVQAFDFCDSMTTVTLGSGIESIGDYAFSHCDSLTDVYISDLSAWLNIDFDHKYSTPMYCAESIYINGTLAEKVGVPAGTTEIKPYVFYGWDCLNSVTLPKSITSIGKSAFYDCTSLTNVSLQSGITSIDESAFYNCKALTSITIPSTVTEIGYHAFNYCTALTDVYISDLAAWLNIDFDYEAASPMYYADNMYINGKLAESVTIPDSITELKSYAFYGWKCLKSAVIPGTVKSFGAYVFSDCDALESVSIGEGVESLGTGAFYCCYSLESVIIPSTAAEVPYRTFYNCISLTGAIIKDGATSIGESAFHDCCNMTAIEIPKSVTSVKEGAFGDCSALTDVYYGGSEDEWSAVTVKGANTMLTGANIHYNYERKINGVTAAQNGGRVTVTVDFDGSAFGAMFAAGYSDGILTDIANVADGTAQLEGSAETVKVFVWDSADGIMPLCEAAEAAVE